MKKLLLYVTIVVAGMIACKKDDAENPYSEITVSMGTDSGNDVYYSLANGEVSELDRSDWDIAFSVPLMTASVIINEGAGVELYCIGDTNDWSLIDENIIDNLQPRYNDKANLMTGAFNINAKPFPNYGWGTYHNGVLDIHGVPNHDVGGDSCYVIKLSDGSYKRFMIRAKLGANSGSIIRWADIDGSNEVVDTVSTIPYIAHKHFLHYSIVNKEIVEAEPEMDTWDLLFTRYVVVIPAGPGTVMNQMVTGILSKKDVEIAKVTDLPAVSAKETDSQAGYVDNASEIGYDWKVFDPMTLEISIADSVSYFIKATDNS